MQRLENIRNELKEEGASGPHIVSIILDGENAWEYYPNDGKAFLNAMYRMLNESTTIKMVTPSEYLALYPEQQELDYLFPGAWFSANYDTWIGEPEETEAWNYLGRVRDFLAKYNLQHVRQAPSAEALAQAEDYMYLAEGSDWFWWYGADHPLVWMSILIPVSELFWRRCMNLLGNQSRLYQRAHHSKDARKPCPTSLRHQYPADRRRGL